MDTSPFANEKKRALLSKFVVTVASLLIILLIAGAVIFTAPQNISTIAYSTDKGSFIYNAKARSKSEITSLYINTDRSISPEALFYKNNNSIYLKINNALIDSDMRISSINGYSPDGTAILYNKNGDNAIYAIIDGKKITIKGYDAFGFLGDNRSLLLYKPEHELINNPYFSQISPPLNIFIRSADGSIKSVAKKVSRAKPLNIKGKHAFIYIPYDHKLKNDEVVFDLHVQIDGIDTLLGQCTDFNVRQNNTYDRFSYMSFEKPVDSGISITLYHSAKNPGPNTIYHIKQNGAIELVSKTAAEVHTKTYGYDDVLYYSYNEPHNLHLFRNGKDYEIDTASQEITFTKNGEYIIYAKDNELYYQRIGSRKPKKITEVNKAKDSDSFGPLCNPEVLGDYIFFRDLSKPVPSDVDLCVTTFGGQKQVIANNCDYYFMAQNRIYYGTTEKKADGTYYTPVYSYKPGPKPEKRLLIEGNAHIGHVIGDDALISIANDKSCYTYLSRSGGEPQLIDNYIRSIEYIK